eukprot:scaffold26650_cov63-Phaeocystis_antarctica.AAC.13
MSSSNVVQPGSSRVAQGATAGALGKHARGPDGIETLGLVELALEEEASCRVFPPRLLELPGLDRVERARCGLGLGAALVCRGRRDRLDQFRLVPHDGTAQVALCLAPVTVAQGRWGLRGGRRRRRGRRRRGPAGRQWRRRYWRRGP